MECAASSISNLESEDPIFYEDVVLGSVLRSTNYLLTQEEIISFAGVWDPFPWHVDPEESKGTRFGSVIAAGVHLLAVKQRLLHDFPLGSSVICSLGFDQLRFEEPGYPGDELYVELIWSDKRLSASQPGLGIVTMQLALRRVDGTQVLSHIDKVLMRLRSAGR